MQKSPRCFLDILQAIAVDLLSTTYMKHTIYLVDLREIRIDVVGNPLLYHSCRLEFGDMDQSEKYHRLHYCQSIQMSTIVPLGGLYGGEQSTVVRVTMQTRMHFTLPNTLVMET